MNERFIRKKILWIGPAVNISLEPFIERNLDFERVNLNGIKNALSSARGIVFNHGNKPKQYLEGIQNFSPIALDYGLFVIAHVPNNFYFQLTRDILDEKFPSLINHQHFSLLWDEKPSKIAEIFARHEPMSSPHVELNINDSSSKIKLTKNEKLLLKRAFSDFCLITVRNLSGGRTEAKIFEVNGQIVGLAPKPLIPLPFFLKIESVENQKKEIMNYEKYVNNFIPFNLRPHLDLKRCISGFEKGLIVGDYIDADLLLDLAQKGRAKKEINHLFDITLNCWRRQTTQTKGKPGNFSSKKILQRFKKIIKLGAMITPKELKSLIQIKVKDFNYTNTLIHRDLHGKNIMVRSEEAVLIDFASVDWGPINEDCAALEVSISVERINLPGGKNLSKTDWKKFVLKIYSPEFLMVQMPTTLGLGDTEEKLWQSIKKVREIAFTQTSTKEEYSFTLAMRLLSISGTVASSDRDDFRKSFIYLLAEKIIIHLATL